MDELDDELKRRISEVFENFNEPSADEGWLLLRQKYPAQDKNRGIIWLWTGIAAAVLLLLGIGLYLFNDHQQAAQQQFTVKPHQQTAPKASTGQTAIRADSDRQSLASAPNNTPANTAPDQHPETAADQHKNNTISGQSIAAVKADKTSARKPGATEPVAKAASRPGSLPNSADAAANRGSLAASNNAAVGNNPSAKTPEQPKSDKTIPGNDQQQPVIAMVKPEQKPNTSENPVGKEQTPASDNGTKKPKPSIFDDPEKANAMAYHLPGDDKPAGKAVRFGVYATTYFNYAKGSNNQVNVGAGISSDIRLSGRLKLSTGVAVTQNSLNYNSQPSLPVAAAAIVPQANNYLAAVNVGNYFGATSAPTFKNYNASMVNLDVPINLKYDLGGTTHNFFVSAGVSSGTFINETYVYNYNTPGLFTADAGATRNQTTTQNFSNFYLARVLNMSFGVGFPMGHGNHLSVEPFVKYPLQGLGAEQIKFGSGGVNLKFNFNTFKK